MHNFDIERNYMGKKGKKKKKMKAHHYLGIKVEKFWI